MKKLEARHFSGQRREYAAWKRDFLDVVAVPGRPGAKRGFTLKSCIHLKRHYLFDNLSLSEHEKMLEILVDKFSKACLIINETIADMEKIEPATMLHRPRFNAIENDKVNAEAASKGDERGNENAK